MADNELPHDLPRQKLLELIGQYGKSLCDDPTRCETLLNDLCKDHRREVFILVSALRAKVAADLNAAAPGSNRDNLLALLTKRMSALSSLPEPTCRWAVDAWAEALGGVRSQESGARSQESEAAAVLPPPSPEHRRIAAAQFDRANQVVNAGQHDYAIQLLKTCCKIDPANLIYRQALRRTEKVKYKNNLKGSTFALITTSPLRAKLKTAKASKDHLKVIELGEELLAYNPWDTGVQLDMALSADTLGLIDLAIWILDQARQKDPADAAVNRPLARLYERRGNFKRAIAHYDLVRKADPRDAEAQSKCRDLAANETIIRGNYEEAVAGEERQMISKSKATPIPDRVYREAEPIRKKLEADPTNASLYLQLATIFRKGGKLEEAHKALQTGLSATGNDFQIMVEIMHLEMEPFRHDLMVAEQKLKAEPSSEELRKLRVRLLKEINSRELELFRQKTDRFPQETAHRIELGLRLLRAGQADEAIRELQTAKADPRQQWKALLYLGHCFRARNNWKLAQRNFDEALKALPPAEQNTKKEILFQLAQGNADAGELAAALEIGHELANLDFLYRDIGRLLDEWQTKLQEA